jgi:hypothetical protein
MIRSDLSILFYFHHSNPFLPASLDISVNGIADKDPALQQ